MKSLYKKIYIILLLLFLPSIGSHALSKDNKIQYTQKNIYNYFSGIISADQDYYNKAFKQFSKVKSLQNKHSQFNTEFLRTLVFLDKFNEAFSFSQEVWNEEELFFEADLLLGLKYFMERDHINAEKHFKRLNEISYYNPFFRDFIGNVLMAWNEASINNEEESFKYLEKIPKPYDRIIKIQSSFIQCYFNDDKTLLAFQQLLQDKEYNFSRYNFFLINYLLYENKNHEAKNIIKYARDEYSSNLLLKETEFFLLNKKMNKIKSFFNCKKNEDSLAEFFYILANLYSSEKDYKLSNFYLKISLFLNKKFLPNKALLAENYYFQKKYELSKNIYSSIKSVGPSYSWFSSKSISTILKNEKGKKVSIKNLENEFNLISNPKIEHYYDLANYYKDYEYYDESIKYYSLILEKIEKDHFLTPKVLKRRGTSLERIGDWKKGEKDLIESLEILPDQPQVLNYLAYTWIDKGINLDQGLDMLKKALKLSVNDGYIIDSIGWAYYAKKNYTKAEFYLQEAVRLLPSDPIINDHYADALWMLNKNIQATYFWKNILKLKGIDQELKDSINKKLIFGINSKI